MKLNKLGLLLVTFAITACSFGSTKAFSWDDYKNEAHAINLQSSRFKDYVLYDATHVQENLDALVNEVKVGHSTSKFISLYNKCSGDLTSLIDSYIIASTKYYSKAEEEFKTKYEEYMALYLNSYKALTALEEDIYHSTDGIKKAYFGNMSDKEIEKMIAGNEEQIILSEYEDIFTALTDEAETYYVDFARTGDKKTFLHNGHDVFLRYINKANELVEKTDYDNYLDLSYKNDYSRDYTIEDVKPFITYVKKYLVPILKEKRQLSAPAGLKATLYNAINNDNFCNTTSNIAELMSSYAEEMGGKYLTSYNDAFKNGIYCFSGSTRSMQTAFQWNLHKTNDAVLYFSRNYQDAFSVTHEFGHYYSTHIDNNAREGDAYDLQETYSQGNEYTFGAYLLDQVKGTDDEATYQYIIDSKFYNELFYIVQEALITEIEEYAYTTPNLTSNMLTNRIYEIMEHYEGTASDTYYLGAVSSSPCYYISYATSLIEALQFKTMDFSTAKKTYKKLIEDTKSMTMVERWTNAGLSSPFEESTFQSLAAEFKKLADKYN
ncbi:MAG: hypothetical protein MJZ37_04250 [Bacilli bacterium]|nr:hypothetical protein [Bacilli bacterium]